jgi:ketosteroid isomerase-like protein
MEEREQQVRGFYEAFNARDVDTLLAAMVEDVDWPNGWEGGRVHGRAAVRDYWERQWAEVDPSVTPTGFTHLDADRVSVEVDQTVRSLAGDILLDGPVKHVYSFDDNGLVVRMDIEE